VERRGIGDPSIPHQRRYAYIHCFLVCYARAEKEHTGSDLSKLSTDITRLLCEQIFMMPIHWAKATNFPETATHAVDSGPGGMSCIGLLTARLLEGRGVRVVIAGDKGKGGAELYNSEGVKYKQWWSKNWLPSLVKTRSVLLIFDLAIWC
jgi:fatty acid synthase subunit alpha, fungi type